MKSSQSTSLLVGVLFATGAAWLAGGCNCGGILFPDGGEPCALPTDCGPGETCVDQVCVPGDGGSNPGQDGGNRNDGGTRDGGTSDGGGGCQGLQCQQVGCPDGGTTTLTGAVYDPSGQVPLYNATVYVPNAALAPFTPGVSCDRCGASISGQPIAITITGADGRFTLHNVPAGTDIPLVMQMGRWRRKVTIPSVPTCQSTPITDTGLLHMPRSRTEGDIPQMAIATGNVDPMECLLKKIGIDVGEFTRPDAPDAGRVHFYTQNGMSLSGGNPPGTQLYSDAGTLSKYDVVFLPCEGVSNPPAKSPAYTQNLINYANVGGRAFITHYGYVWIAWAQQPFPSTADWRPDARSTNGETSWSFSLDRSFPKGQAFADWLANVGASDGGSLTVSDARHDVYGVDAGTTRWVYGPMTPSNSMAVEHLTFNTPVNPPPLPDGDAGVQCGRVLFSDFHVSANAKSGNTFPTNCNAGALTAQEKALVFMLFDLSACVQDDNTAPSVCGAINNGCTLDSQCCTGLACQDALGFACGGAGCTCQVPFN